MRQARRWIERFLGRLSSERRLSPMTCETYRRDLDLFIDFCRRHGVNDLNMLTPAEIRTLIAERHLRGVSAQTIRRMLSALRTFFRFLMQEGAMAHNPAADIPAPRAGRRLPEVLDVDRVASLLMVPNASPLAVRDRAIMELLYSSGLRVSELVALDLADLRLAEGLVRVQGKGRKVRVVPVGQTACRVLAEWLELRGQFSKIGEAAVFTNQRGDRLSRRSIQDRLHRWSLLQGLETRVYPHLLRHCCASHLLESSGDLRAVQELLGHADIATTQIYSHLDFQHLSQVYDQAHPRAKRKRPCSKR
ncbi:MAG: tyrosine recombinase XerC [Gammaproteobacteria bacterium]